MIQPQDRLEVQSKELLQRPRVRWLTAGINDQPGNLLLTVPPHDDNASFVIPPTNGIHEAIATKGLGGSGLQSLNDIKSSSSAMLREPPPADHRFLRHGESEKICENSLAERCAKPGISLCVF